MRQNFLHIGLDVDDIQFHGAALNQTTGEVLDFKCRPNLKGLLGQLDKLASIFQAALSSYVMKRLISVTACNETSLKKAITVM